MTVEISAVLTTYRRPELARRALESILAQTLPAAQIIVVEDGSETWLSDWISDLGRSDVEYLRHEENRGLAAARNTGLRLARHDFIAYLDDDDCWHATRLEAQAERWHTLSAEARESIAAVQVGCEILDERDRRVGSSMPINEGRLRDSIMDRGASTPSSCFLFSRSALRAIGGFDESLISGIDHDIWMKLAVAGYSSIAIARPLVTVYKDARQSMMSNTTQRIRGIDQYVQKWTPTYEEWFGASHGRSYARRYAIRVTGRLAGEKLAGGRFREFAEAAASVFSWADGDFSLRLFGVRTIARAGTIATLQRIRAALRIAMQPRVPTAQA